MDDIKELLILDYIHRDPFDRMIIAQAKTTDSIIVSKDRHFQQYDVKLLWKSV
jgi:PIN domain nuclease of toxin-antitoxin system